MIYVSGHQGYGDNLYMRPYVQRLLEHEEVWLQTPWPEIHSGCHYVRSNTSLYHAQRNQAIQGHLFGPEPKGAREITLEYGSGVGRGLSILEALAERAKLPVEDKLSWDAEGEPFMDGLYAVCHPPTVRKQFFAPARNPDPKAFRQLVDLVRKAMPVIAVGHLKDEKVEGDYYFDGGYLNGQFPMSRLPGIVRGAALVLTSPCFLLPLAMSVGAETICMFGGHHAPEVLIPPGNEVRVLAPEPFCRPCHQKHVCPDKRIDPERIASCVTQAIGAAGRTTSVSC